MSKIGLVCLLIMYCFWVTDLSAQNAGGLSNRGPTNVITTTVPFLLITPDARSAGLADAGVAISPDANAMYWTPAKIAFAEEDMAFSASYTPWLRTLTPDINLFNASMYKKIDALSGFGIAVRYFSLGEITVSNSSGVFIKTVKPFEIAVDEGYSRKLSKHFSMGITGRLIYSALEGSSSLLTGAQPVPVNGEFQTGKAFAINISAYYTNQVKIVGKSADMSFGGNISNIGTRISYTKGLPGEVLPANLKIGGCLNMHMDQENEIALMCDLNKLLVPTPPVFLKNSKGTDSMSSGGALIIEKGMDPSVSVVQGMVQSFYDAPGGFAEEMREINPSLAIEYRYHKMISVRTGYFYEAPDKGGRRYFTYGLGGRFGRFTADVSYLLPLRDNRIFGGDALSNTFYFSLGYNISQAK